VIRLRKNEETGTEKVVKARQEIKEFVHKGFLIKCSVLQEESSLDVSVTIDKVPYEIQEEGAWVGFQYFVPSHLQQNYQLTEEFISNHTYDKYQKIMDRKTNTEVEYVSIHSETSFPLTLHKAYVLTQPLLDTVEIYILVKIQEEKRLLTMKIETNDE